MTSVTVVTIVTGRSPRYAEEDVISIVKGWGLEKTDHNILWVFTTYHEGTIFGDCGICTERAVLR
jgi:hypothetical protein